MRWWRHPRLNLRRTFDPAECNPLGKILSHPPWSVWVGRHGLLAVLTVRHDFATGWMWCGVYTWASWEKLTMVEKKKLAEDLVARARAKRAKGGDGPAARDEELGVRCPYVHAFLSPATAVEGDGGRGAVVTMWCEGTRFVVKLLDTWTELCVYADGAGLWAALGALEALLSCDEVPWRTPRGRGKKRS